MQAALASGGTGNVNEMWEYTDDWLYGWGWYPFWFGGSPWAGLYMKIYTAPPIEETTCDIYGYKFDDQNGSREWDGNESEIPGWEMYVDLNNDNVYQPSEPNVVTDPNGMYFFENLDAPATYTIREMMRDGWNQTLPGGPDYEYTIIAEPNNVYGPCNFGNTTQPQTVTLSGYVTWEDGTPYPGIQIDLDLDGHISTAEQTAITNSEGFYQFAIMAPWTGTVMIRLPDRWYSHWPAMHENVTTDITEDYVCIYRYDAGSGTEADPYQILTAEQLLMIGRQSSHWEDHFVLTDDIDLSGTSYSPPIIAPGYAVPFTGQFDGMGFSVLNLQGSSGLFGYLRNAVIKNLGVENVEITTGGIVGALCQANHGGTIENCFSTGNISGLFDVGGLCGWVHTEYLGDYPIPVGGGSLPPVNTPVIRNCYSSVNVILVHPNMLPEVSFGAAGGLCAYAEGAELSNNYACGSVRGTGCSTPFDFDIVIDNGGLVGRIEDCDVYNNYSSAHVMNGLAYSHPGGFCGRISGTQTISVGNYWDIETSDQSTSACGTGLPTEQMQMMATYTGWDFETVWRICDGMNYPRLQWEPRPVGDFVCPEGVESADLMVLCDEWLMEVVPLSADVAPQGAPDGKVNLLDFALFAENWLTGTDE